MSQEFSELRSKVTSEEQLASILLKYRLNPVSLYRSSICVNRLGHNHDTTTPGGSIKLAINWWAVREHLRFEKKIYETTDVLDFVNERHPMAFAHVSLEDRTMVAYTVDKAGGESDRQVRLAVGRLLSKLFPLYTDDVIAAMATEHNAEISDEIFFLEGDAISEFYSKDTKTGACMSGKAFAHQPTLAYSAPGIRMAYVKDGTGAINGRAMVYEVSETDKRFIRTYGSPLLQKRLMRHGYKAGAWCGVAFNTFYFDNGKPFVEGEEGSDEEVKIACPYLDSNGSMAGEGSSVALLGGKLRSLTKSQRQLLEARQASEGRKNLVSSGSSAGYVRLRNIPSSELTKTCTLSGEPYNVLTDSTVYVYDWEKQVRGFALPKAVNDEWLTTTKNGMMTQLPADMPEIFMAPKAQMIYHRGRMQIKSVEFYTKAGYLKLDPDFYSEDLDSWKLELRQTKEGFGILAADAALLYEDPESPGRVVHVKTIQVAGRKLVKLHAVPSEIPGYAIPSAVHLTASGRKVHPKYNSDNLVRTPIGWEFRRNTVHNQFYVLNVCYTRHKSQSITETEAALQIILEREISKVLDCANIGASISKLFQEQCWIVPLTCVGDRLVSIDNLSELSMADLQQVLQPMYDSLTTRSYGTTQKAFVLKLILQWMAQANATDFNTEVQPVTNTVTVNPIEVTLLPAVELPVTVNKETQEATHV